MTDPTSPKTLRTQVAPGHFLTSAEATQAARQMSRFGGNFVRHLAAAYFAADEGNQRKLLEAFTEYFEKYFAMPEDWRPAS